MSRSVTYRERDTERETWEEKPRRTYTTVRRYQVPEESSRSSRYEEDDVKEKLTIKRTSDRREVSQNRDRDDINVRITERSGGDTHRDDYDYRVTERVRERPREEEDFHFTERIVERDREPRRDVTYRVVERERDDDHYSRSGRSDYRSDFKYVEKDREVTRAPSPPSPERVQEFRFSRERSFSPPARSEHHRERERDRGYDVERYSKSTEYFAQPQPQPIIIRESAPAAPIIIREERRDPPPIIIREERREPRFEFIERQETTNDRALVKREDPPSSSSSSEVKSVAKSVAKSATVAKSEKSAQTEKPEEEDYFYERRIREYDRRQRDVDVSHDRHREVHPRESASNYSSDDGSYEYYRKEKTYYDDRDHDPHHKLHLAEGAVAGIGAAELLRRHRKSEGKPANGRLTSAVSGAAVGALGAEAITRFRSRSRRRASSSRSRSWSGDRRSRGDRRRDRSRSRSRSRSKSISRKQLGGLAAVAAVGALAGYALKNRGKNNETIIVNDGPPPRRSRSHRHRSPGDLDPEANKHRDPSHRNQRIAQAGLASAAAAGIWEHTRSKSRHRSKSHLRQGIPVAAAGLGGAALAGLYEKNKASKEAKRDAIVADEMNRGRRRSSRSRNRSVSRSAYSEDPRRGPPVDDQGMIAYGNEPIPPDQRRGFDSDEEPGMYQRRHRGGSSAGSSPDTRRRRSRSRGRDYAEAAGAAGLGGLAAHEYDRRHRDNDMHNDPYGYGNSGRYTPSQAGYLGPNEQGYPPQQGYGQQQQPGYPQSPYFPPPPTADQNYAAPYQPYPEQPQHQNPYPTYNPADFTGGGQHEQGPANSYGASRDFSGEQEHPTGPRSPGAGGEGYPREAHHAGEQPPPQSPGDERNGGRRDNPDNVSATQQEEYDVAANHGSRGGSMYPAGAAADEEEEDEDEDERRRGRNVSTATEHQQQYQQQQQRGVNSESDGQRTPRPRSSSRVRFDLDANQEHSPETRRKHTSSSSRPTTTTSTDSSADDYGDRRSRRQQHSNRNDRSRSRSRGGNGDSSDGARDSPHLMHDQYERRPDSMRSSRRSSRSRRGDGNNSNDANDRREDDESDSTIDLPDRFDSSGNRVDRSNSLSELLLGREGQGGLLSSFLGGSSGGSGGTGGGSGDRGSDRGSDGRSGRRRSRR